MQRLFSHVFGLSSLLAVPALANTDFNVPLAGLMAPSSYIGTPLDRAGRRSTSISAINRNTGRSHQHRREIARRSRQNARLQAKYMLNGGFTRSGRETGPLAA